MKTIFYSITLLFLILGLINLCYLLYIELKLIIKRKKAKKNIKRKNRERIYLYLIIFLIVFPILIERIEYLFNL